MSSQLILAPLFAFVIAHLLIAKLISSAVPKVLDYPNVRSLHDVPVPRTGGIGIVIGILAAWSLLDISLPLELWISVSLLTVVSFVDDLRSLPIFLRLVIHSAVAMVFSFSLFYPSYGGLMTFGIGLAVLWMINLYNFMDGSDGLAGGMALIGFGYYGLAAFLAGNYGFAIINLCIVGAAAAFLLFNFHPARIFMGDAGSVTLGYLAAALGILGWIEALWPPWFPLLIFSPFIADATTTLVKRLLRGDRVWQAHCEHYYQRLVRCGLGHRNTALLSYLLMLIAGGSALWSTRQDSLIQGLLAVIWAGIYFIMMTIFDHYQRNRFSD